MEDSLSKLIAYFDKRPAI